MSRSVNSPPLPLPKGFSRDIQPDRLILRRTGRANEKMGFLVLFAFIWNAMMLGWFFTTPIRWASLSMNELVPFLFVGIGLCFAYVCLGMFVNTTVVEIGPEILRVSTGPLPWHPQVSVPAGEISNVIFREHAQPGYSSTYRVMVVLGAFKEVQLVRLTSYEQIVFYVREIRGWLKLPDVTLSPDA